MKAVETIFVEEKKRIDSSFINYVVLSLKLICIDSVLLNEAVFMSDFIDAKLNTN